MKPFQARFRSLFLAILVAILPGGLVAAFWPPLGTVTFTAAAILLWVALDQILP